MPEMDLNVPMEKVTVGEKRKMIKVICWGTDFYAIESVKGEQYFIPHSFRCLTKYEKRAWIAETMIDSGGRPLYRFCDVKTSLEGPWWDSPTGALQRANELVGNAFHGKGYNGRIVIGISYPNAQMRIERMIQNGQLRKVGEKNLDVAVPLAHIVAPLEHVSRVEVATQPLDVTPSIAGVSDPWQDFARSYQHQEHDQPFGQSFESIIDKWMMSFDEDEERASKRNRTVSLSDMDVEPADAGLPCDLVDEVDPPVEPLTKKSSFHKSASQTSFEELVLPDGIIDDHDVHCEFGSSC